MAEGRVLARMSPPVLATVFDPRDVERDLLDAQETLRRIVAQADACLAGLQDRARLSRRVRTAAARRRAQSTLPLAAA